MDTYLLWALNTLFQELFNTQLPLVDNTAFTTMMRNNLASPPQSQPAPTPVLPFTSTPSAPLPIPESAPAGVQQALQQAAAATGLSPALLRAVATVESGLNPTVVSSAGAVGLMQLMPQTAAALGINSDNVSQNALGGAELLKSLLGQFGQNLSLALAAYNAGPGAVTHYGGVPPYAQTQQYVSDVLSQYQSAQPHSATTPAGSSWTA